MVLVMVVVPIVPGMGVVMPLFVFRHADGVVFPCPEPKRFHEDFQNAVEMRHETEKEEHDGSDRQDRHSFDERDRHVSEDG